MLLSACCCNRDPTETLIGVVALVAVALVVYAVHRWWLWRGGKWRY